MRSESGPGTTLPDPRPEPEWWLAHLAAVIREALRTKPPEIARSHLQDALDEFRASPACSPHLNSLLGGRRPRPRKVLEPLPDDYDLSQDWKPCANPECRAPIPRRSRKTYCDATCRIVAKEYAGEEEFGPSNMIPF